MKKSKQLVGRLNGNGWLQSGACLALLLFGLSAHASLLKLQYESVEPSGSMENTIALNDVVVIDRTSYGPQLSFSKTISRNPQRGEIVAFTAPEAARNADDRARHKGKAFIKRVIGVPGDAIQIKSRKVSINGQLLNEPYAIFRKPPVAPRSNFSLPKDFDDTWRKGQWAWWQPPEDFRDDFGPVTLKADEYFVLGDNRDRSYDSRFFGPVMRNLFVGKVIEIHHVGHTSPDH